MVSAIFTEDYEVLVSLLVSARRQAGLSQRGLAARIGRSQSHINMIEKRQRRIEVREFYLLCKALGADPAVVFQTFADAIEARQAA